MGKAIESLLAQLEPEIEDAEEEAFLLFAQTHPSQNLGFIDSKASSLDLTINGHDLTVTQSPAILSSNRANGTTGAVVWKVTPLFASWLASSSSSQAGDGPSDGPSSSSTSTSSTRKTTKGHQTTTTNNDKANILFRTGVLSSTSTVLELGCGVSALVGLATSPLVHRYILTDQPYVARFVEQNISQNISSLHSSKRSISTTTTTKRKAPGGTGRAGGETGGSTGKLTFHPLDWELDTLTPALCIPNLVVACDCVYNDALIAPLVQTCVDACKLQLLSSSSTSSSLTKKEKNEDGEAKSQDARPATCVVAQQLRVPEVFEAWLSEFMRKGFRVWRVPDNELPEGLRSSSGFVVHIGILGEALKQSQS